MSKLVWAIVQRTKSTGMVEGHKLPLFDTRQAALLYIKKRGDTEYYNYDVEGIEPMSYKQIKALPTWDEYEWGDYDEAS